MTPGRLDAGNQRLNLSPQYIVNLQPHVALNRQLIADGGGRVKGIGVAGSEKRWGKRLTSSIMPVWGPKRRIKKEYSFVGQIYSPEMKIPKAEHDVL
jgi:hypothetical protein